MRLAVKALLGAVALVMASAPGRADPAAGEKIFQAKKNARARLIFTKKMPCTGCHQYPAKKRKKFKGGMSGPTLVGAGKRLNPDWIYAYLKNPKVFKPFKMMPVFAGIMKDRDMKKVAAHVASFK